MARASKPAKRLGTYQAKRDFTRTPEPSGAAGDGDGHGRRFVVQHHRARRDHYDFRLEVDGVLASWAVPKGPTLDPKARRLAVHVEDHPIEYRDFEGIIPGGEYGGGDVIVWDNGTYEPVDTDDPAASIEGGELHFDLEGHKLRGRFVLVRTRPDRAGREQWLMLHKRDDFATEGWSADDHPLSVKSGRTNDEVAADPEAQWHSDRPPDQAEVPVRSGGPTPSRSGSATVAKRGGPRGDAKGRGSRAATRRRDSGAAAVAAVEPASDDELAALDALSDNGEWEVQGRTLKLTNLDKVLFPGRDGETARTKRDLIRYHVTMAPALVPYLADRPVNMHRFPNGVDRPGFWHKQVPNHAPPWLRRWHNPDARRGDSDTYAVVEDAAGLAWMANFGAVELHAWTSKIPDVREPTWALIDIDPGTKTTFEDIVYLAQLYRAGMDHLGVTGLPKLTGQRGIHIWIPIEPGYTFDDTRTWVEGLSRAVGSTAPELVSWTWEKRARHGLARLDYTQNAINKTLVVPYGVRAAAGGPVSVPVDWDELEAPDLRSDAWTMSTAPGRLTERGDLFAPLLASPQRLPDL
jgi:bifunctional non-homologous end joining protein LigD